MFSIPTEEKLRIASAATKLNQHANCDCSFNVDVFPFRDRQMV